MRLHRLEIQAFGPFASPQSVDFDVLAEHGLFLLNGATGSGKTSVLDAVCFALYGGLPGARLGSKSLKSHHSEATAQPEAVLEFSAQGRRFEVRRTPEWQRPSARSKSGFVTQQASTQLRELVHGEWQALSSRNDEASALLRDVLGMDREQFTRVVMLPQGEFATFLRAKPADREDLLESLFATGRFSDVEAQLGAMARDAEEGAIAAEQAARLPVRQLEGELPEAPAWPGSVEEEECPRRSAFDDDAPLDAEAIENVFAWAIAGWDAAAEQADKDITAARDDVSAARGAEESCRRALEDARELASARLRSSRWEAQGPDNTDREERLRLAAQAAALRAELGEERRAAAAAEEAAQSLSAALAAAAAAGWAPPPGEELTPTEIRSEAGDAHAEAAVLAERIPIEEELERLTAGRDAAESHIEVQLAARAGWDLELSALDSSLAELSAERNRIEPRAAARATAERDARAARDVVEAVQEHSAVTARLASAEQALLKRRNDALEKRSRWLDLREERLTHTAFELAAELVEGAACPVCGSEDHPRPAVGENDPLKFVDLEQEASAAAELAVEAERAAALAVADAKAALAAVVARGGAADPDKAARELDEAAHAMSSAAAAEARLAVVLGDLESRELRRRKAAQERETSVTALALATTERDRLAAEIRERSSAVVEWRAGWPTLRARHAAVSAVARALAPLAEAAAQVAATRVRHEEAQAAFAAVLAPSPFADEGQARAALVGDAEIQRLRSAVDAHRAEEQAIAGLLSSASAVRALEAEQAEASAAPASLEAQPASGDARARLEGRLAASRDDLVRAEARLATAQTTHHTAELSSARCERLRAAFRAAVPPLQRERAQADLLAELQRTARGGGENRFRMSLHRYVLAARLEQVAAAASERLDVMSDGRFGLEHTDALAARGAASGLGLEITDSWTGQRRDPATLSGGESFMASLALALGLADVVQQESGGVDIETLFVDEGFGTLDEQTLEQVMEAIEGLRDGGRTVGLVSHVPELKQRIPAQIRVTKGRSGSSLAVVTGGDLG